MTPVLIYGLQQGIDMQMCGTEEEESDEDEAEEPRAAKKVSICSVCVCVCVCDGFDRARLQREGRKLPAVPRKAKGRTFASQPHPQKVSGV